MVARRYIGVTGFTSVKEVGWMTEALGGEFGMYGVLATPETIRGEAPRRGRYARVEDLSRLFGAMPADAVRALHYCPRGRLDTRLVVEAVNACGPHLNAVQLNTGGWPGVDVIKELKFGRLSDIGLIFQIGPGMLASAAKEVADRFCAYDDLVDYVLLDGSGGRGIPLAPGLLKNVVDLFREKKYTAGIVVAGGLSAGTLHYAQWLIRQDGVGIDAEGRLMNKDDKLDRLALQHYVAEARRMFVDSKKEREQDKAVGGVSPRPCEVD